MKGFIKIPTIVAIVLISVLCIYLGNNLPLPSTEINQTNVVPVCTFGCSWDYR